MEDHQAPRPAAAVGRRRRRAHRPAPAAGDQAPADPRASRARRRPPLGAAAHLRPADRRAPQPSSQSWDGSPTLPMRTEVAGTCSTSTLLRSRPRPWPPELRPDGPTNASTCSSLVRSRHPARPRGSSPDPARAARRRWAPATYRRLATSSSAPPATPLRRAGVRRHRRRSAWTAQLGPGRGAGRHREGGGAPRVPPLAAPAGCPDGVDGGARHVLARRGADETDVEVRLRISESTVPSAEFIVVSSSAWTQCLYSSPRPSRRTRSPVRKQRRARTDAARSSTSSSASTGANDGPGGS